MTVHLVNFKTGGTMCGLDYIPAATVAGHVERVTCKSCLRRRNAHVKQWETVTDYLK